MTDAKGDFAEELNRHSKKVFDAAQPAMTHLAELASALKMPTAQEHINASLEGLRRPSFTMIVFGRFSTGKSTFLNVLLGRLDHPTRDLPNQLGAPLPMDDMPVNARVTTIRYGETPTVTVVRTDGSRDQRSLKWFVDNSPLRATHKESQEAFRDIEQFELTYPFGNGKAGIILIDTPGTDEASERDMVALRALNQADAAILLFRTDPLGGKEEIEFANRMVDLGLTNYFTVINRFHGKIIDERFKKHAWDKIVRELKGGPEYASDRFAEQRVYFVDALAALNGRLSGDEEKVRASGIIEFESALANFYETERRKVHIQRWVDQALGQASKMNSFVKGQIPALMVEASDFQRIYEEIEPKARELAKRKNQPAKVFNRFRSRAQGALSAEIQGLYLSIANELPAVLKDRKLESLDGVGALMWAGVSEGKRKSIGKEVSGIIGNHFAARMHAWQTAELPEAGMRAVLDPLVEDLLSELQDEVTRTEQEFGALKLELANRVSVEAEVKSERKSEWWTRIGPAAVGLVFGPDMALAGARDGWKGFGKSLIVHLGMAIGLAIVGLMTPVGWGVLIAAWIGSFFARGAWRGVDIQGEIKSKAIHAVSENLIGKIEEAKKQISGGLDEMTSQFESEITARFEEEIDQQMQDLERMRKDSALSRDEKTALINLYNKIDTRIGGHVVTLNYVRSMAAV